jgi:acyl-coenzyme A synthetase/AMP-(fatty) acid ligase
LPTCTPSAAHGGQPVGAKGKGDRVLIYMPMIAEAAFAMLAVRASGRFHCVVQRFSPAAPASH